jgi:2-iminobutanoate/2-iminopropanoate deaminase
VRTISSQQAPAAIGPYAQAVVTGGFLFTAGQIALDPATGKMVDGGITEQTKQVFANLTAVLEAAETTWDDVVKTTVFLADLGDFPAVNELYAQQVGTARPARSTVQVSALPRGALIEIEAIVRVGD